MGAAARTRELDIHPHDLRPRMPTLPDAQIIATQPLHDDVDEPLEVADVVDRDHAGMCDLGERASLSQRSIIVGSGEQLDRDLSLERGIVREVDGAHGPATEHAQNPIAIYLDRTDVFPEHRRGEPRPRQPTIDRRVSRWRDRHPPSVS
jgi:hypothetical protein